MQYKNNNNASNYHANKVIKTRASSLSPTKNMTPKSYHNQHNKNNIHTPNSPETAKKMMKAAKQQSKQLLPPRFSMKKQVSAPATQNSSYKPTAINKSEPTFRNKKLTSTAMNRKLNNTPPFAHDNNNTDSNNTKIRNILKIHQIKQVRKIQLQQKVLQN